MNLVKRSITYIADHQHLNLVVGLILLYCGLNEAWATIWQDIQTLSLGGHHGVIVLGLVTAFKSFSHLQKGTG